MADDLASPAFFGPPGRLRWAGGSDACSVGQPRSVRLPPELAAYADPHHPVLRRGRDPRRMRLRLGATAPPGDYHVDVAYADGSTQQVAVSIEPRPRLRVLPGTLRLAGAPGASVSARLLVENRGNEVLEIGDSLVTGIFDDNGIEAALAAVYRLETDDLDTVVATGFARLREAHGGLLRLRVREGAGALAPGDSRQLLLQTTLNSKLAPRHGYHGTLELGTHRIAVRVAVRAASDPETPAGGPR